MSLDSLGLTAKFIAEIQELSAGKEEEEQEVKLPKKRMRWSREESELLISLRHQKPNTRWEIISQNFPSFTPTQVRRHYYSLVKSPVFTETKTENVEMLKNEYHELAKDEKKDGKLKMLADLKQKLTVLETMLENSTNMLQDFMKEVKSNQ